MIVQDDPCVGFKFPNLSFDLTAHTQASLASAISTNALFSASQIGGFPNTPAVQLEIPARECPNPVPNGVDITFDGPIV